MPSAFDLSTLMNVGNTSEKRRIGEMIDGRDC